MSFAYRHPPALRDPVEVLQWGCASFGSLALASSLGPGSTALVELAVEHGLDLPVFLLDTGLLFPETVQFARRLEAHYSIAIHRVRPRHSVEEQAVREGPGLWERAPDRCCHLRKVRPLAEALTGLEAWVTGLRRDQAPTRAGIATVEWDARHGLVKLNPLAHWSRAELDAFIAARGIPQNPLFAQGFASVGCWPCTEPSTDERAGRWAGSAKTECGIHFSIPTDSPEEA